jgi:hypothetical protein
MLMIFKRGIEHHDRPHLISIVLYKISQKIQSVIEVHFQEDMLNSASSPDHDSFFNRLQRASLSTNDQSILQSIH